MMFNNDFYIELACNSHLEMGQMVCGNHFVKKSFPHHISMVLCNGGSNGFKSNVVASMIASMALSSTNYLDSMVEVGRNTLNSFLSNSESDVKDKSITIIKISDKFEVTIVEFGSPKALVLEGCRVKQYASEKVYLAGDEGLYFKIYSFTAKIEDRVVFMTDGVTLSGYSTGALPTGWGEMGVEEFVLSCLVEKHDVSAMELSRRVIDEAYKHDASLAKRDISCGVVYFRRPRKLLVCTGPPYDKQNDVVIADIVKNYTGDVIVSGGSTSQIIARELGRELVSQRMRDVSGLPPTYGMEGIKIVTEGVLTLGRVKSVLDRLKTERATGEGIDIVFVNELLEHDTIDFIVGTRINELHQNPNVPIELELRRSVVSEIARTLENKFMKSVTKRYF